MDRAAWKEIITNFAHAHPKVVDAVIFHAVYNSDSIPLLVTASDGSDYVVKAPWPRTETWRMSDPGAHDRGKPGAYLRAVMVNEQIVGRISTAIGAATPPVALVRVSREFLEANALEIRIAVQAAGFPHAETFQYLPGVAHGSRHITKLSTRYGFNFVDEYPNNHARIASLAVLYGLTGVTADLQCFYDMDTKEAYSVDHGLAFGGTPFWGILPPKGFCPGPNQKVVEDYGLSAEEIDAAALRVDFLTTTEVGMAVSAPPADWDHPERNQIRAADYIWSRKEGFKRTTDEEETT